MLETLLNFDGYTVTNISKCDVLLEDLNVYVPKGHSLGITDVFSFDILLRSQHLDRSIGGKGDGVKLLSILATKNEKYKNLRSLNKCPHCGKSLEIGGSK